MNKSQREFQEDLTNQVSETAQSPDAITAEFASLKAHPAWVRLVGILAKKVDGIASEILDSDIKDADLDRARDRRDLCLWFKNLPDIIIEAQKQNPIVSIDENDPYERPDQQGVENAK